jgi:predicted  nucleic acid-binding Zn-ribbon protein
MAEQVVEQIPNTTNLELVKANPNSDALATMIDNYNVNLDKIDKGIHNTEEMCNAIEDNVNANSKKTDDMEEKVDDLDRKVDELDAKMEGLEKSCSSEVEIKAAIAALRKDVDRLQVTFNSLSNVFTTPQ